MPFSRRRSLAIKIPAVISALLLAALAAVSLASYLQLRGALIEMSTSRLQQAADQMANVLTMSARQRVAAIRPLMQMPEVRDFVVTQNPAQRAPIEAAMRTYLGAAAAFADVELWDANGQRLLAVGAPYGELTRAEFEEYKAELQSTDQPTIGKLRAFGEALRYPVGGPIVQDGRISGYLIERRGLNNPAQTRQTVALLTGLIGNQATMVVGNQDGSTWSDLVTVVRDVPVSGTTERLWEYQRSGMAPTFAWTAPIASTPWTVAIEFPRAVVLAPLRQFIINSIVLSSVVLIVAAAIGWIVTRRITTPLAHVTAAAEAVAVADAKPARRIETDREDEVGRLAESFNKMTERVELARADLELRVELRTSELKSANRELEAFSYSVSHDLRAPLRAIAGFVQILEEDHAGQFNAEARRALDRVKVNARRMGQLIDDLLSFSRIGRTTMVRQTIDLTALANGVAREAIAASGRQIDLTVEPLPPVYGEPALLTQVFANLISNAIKFTARTDGAAITIGSKAGTNETIYFVRDNGAGFDDRYAEKLFGVFQRLHRTDDFEGTGVGLAIVHRIISRHGGRVWAEGKLNGGATFYFTLPAAKAVEGTPAAKPESKSA